MPINLKATALIFSAGILFSACTKAPPVTYVTPTATPEATPSPMASVTIALAEQSKSGLTGTAVLEDLGNNKTKVTITLTGKTTATPQPAHVHTGTCVKPGDVVYPLTNVVNGKSETTLDANLAAIKQKGTLINIHKSAKEANVYVACGEWAQKASVSPSPASSPTNY